MQSRRFLTKTERQPLSQGWLRDTLITSSFKSVFDSPQLSSSINDQDGGIALFPKKKNMDRPEKYAYFAGYVYDRLP